MTQQKKVITRTGSDSSIPEGRARAVIENVKPEVDSGLFPIKRVVGEKVIVEADIFADGHDSLSAFLLHRRSSAEPWAEVPMGHIGNDRWRGSFVPSQIGTWSYTLTAWVDRFKTWRTDLAKRAEAGQDVDIALLVGAKLMLAAARRAVTADADVVIEWIRLIEDLQASKDSRLKLALSDDVASLMEKYPDRRFSSTYAPVLEVHVDRERALYGAWYEMFPRSASAEPGRHGTFKDCERLLPYVAEMGFDVLYIPPHHPIGITNRKGKNNSTVTGPEDPGTPWAIGSAEGGHDAVHPQLGTVEDFSSFVSAAKDHGIEIAIDIAFQCSPDHPYVKTHPEWFEHRPDGTIQYAENPPKKYQDIYPLNFETPDWRRLWDELKRVVFYWLEHDIRIFRVDNPHTKPFQFWDSLIRDVKNEFPEAIFLAEAFTRPKVMYRLAKIGFSQSYTYFTWRNTKPEITDYLTELTKTGVREFFRPNLWPNTPDILHEYLQTGGRPAFEARFVLAATLGASYGIYGPPFELMEARPKEPGSEEYLDSEKYEIKFWDRNGPSSLKEFITRVNRIRRENVALHRNTNLRFHHSDNSQIICYSKHDDDMANIVLVVVNLQTAFTHSGWIEVPLGEWGIDPEHPYQMHDLMTDARYLWQGVRNYVELDPRISPVHIFRVRRHIRTERDFDYFL